MTRQHRCRATARACLVAGALAVAPLWSSNWAAAHSIAQTWKPGDEGAPSCALDAFSVAAQLLGDPALRYVVAGRVVALEGLPETLLDADHEFEVELAELDRLGAVSVVIEGRPAATIDTADVLVEARLRVSSVLKPSPRCPHPPDVDEGVRCARADSLPAELTLRIPSDWFLWPATGTSRRVARRAGRHILALRELDRQRRAGEIGESEYAEEKKVLESQIERGLTSVEVEYRRADVVFPMRPQGRLLEDRHGRIEVGGEYLLGLGAGEEDPARTHHRPAKPASWSNGNWPVFWGEEARDVGRALMLMGNCVRREPPLFTSEFLVSGCSIYARGLATFWLYPDFPCRH